MCRFPLRSVVDVLLMGARSWRASVMARKGFLFWTLRSILNEVFFYSFSHLQLPSKIIVCNHNCSQPTPGSFFLTCFFLAPVLNTNPYPPQKVQHSLPLGRVNSLKFKMIRQLLFFHHWNMFYEYQMTQASYLRMHYYQSNKVKCKYFSAVWIICTLAENT